MIKPTIGRRVWYWPSPKQLAEGVFHMEDAHQACDAGVVFVVSDTKVHLLVTDHWGRIGFVKNVRLLQDNDVAVAEEAHAQWMPYQVASDAKQKAEAEPDKVVKTVSPSAVGTQVKK